MKNGKFGVLKVNPGILTTVSLLLALSAMSRAVAGPGEEARRIMEDTGVQGGLVVHAGCETGELAAALRQGEQYVVQGLVRNAADVEQAREYIRSKDLYGPVSVEQWEGEHLPYIDNLVNLLIVDNGVDIATNEIMRVLAPLGIAYMRQEDGSWQKKVKAWPDNIDEWPHYLGDADNNAVANDEKVGPPRHMQWNSGPMWTRNHHKLNSISSMVSADGRVFSIQDEATAANMSVPGKWNLSARDAFSGVLLWKKPIGSWAYHRIRFRSGPPQLARLLVAGGKRVYAPLGLGEPVSALDAVDGETLSTYAGTDGAEEIVIVDDTLLVLTGSPIPEQARKHPEFSGKQKKRTLHAIDVASGRPLWKWSSDTGRIRAETLGSDGSRAYVQVSNGVVCLDMKDGSTLWSYGETAEAGGRKKPYGTYTLLVSDGVVICNIGGSARAISADDGSELWRRKKGKFGFNAPLDIFVIDGVVWMGSQRQGSTAPPATDDFNVGFDLHTGEPTRGNSVAAELQTAGHHHRCYREKATSRYIITGKRGVDLIDLEGENHSRNNWVRGTCQYGVMPANGFIYIPPHSCGCYMESLLHGFWALANKQEVMSDPKRGIADADRLEKGPAYGRIKKPESASQDSNDWPAYRRNAIRSGASETSVSCDLKTEWEMQVGGKLTQPVVAEEKLLVAAVDEFTVYALDEKTGSKLWSYTCGGKVDSPPTIQKGKVLFGSADGHVYCLRADDGELVWRFNAAPLNLKSVSCNRPESVWPVHGSVLVQNDTAYFAAGRSSWIDGGIHLYALDPASGKMLHKHQFRSKHPEFQEVALEFKKRIHQNAVDRKTLSQSDHSDAFSMAGGTRSDVLVGDGKNVFLHQVQFDPELKRTDRMSAHLFSTSSLLDGTENHRSHWMLGTGDFSRLAVAYSWIVNRGGGWGQAPAVPYGAIMAFDDRAVWGVHRRNGRADGQYAIFRRKNKALAEHKSNVQDIRKVPKGEKPYPYIWRNKLDVRPRALVEAGGRLFLGATPTNVPEDDPHAAYEGRMGGIILVFDAEKGDKLAELKLDSPVVWDGMSAANGKLYFSTRDGKVVCYGKESTQQ